MIKIENIEVAGLAAAIRGMRNPMNSWAKSDSGLGCGSIRCSKCGYQPYWCGNSQKQVIGSNDHDLMMRLAKQGPVHGKYRRMIVAYMDITAPLYWWKEFDTYKVGTIANSCSTMHKIHAKEFTLEDCSHEHLMKRSLRKLLEEIEELNFWREIYLNGGMVDNEDGTARTFNPKDKDAWWQMIQILPSSYNQRRTVMVNYEVLANMRKYRWNHKQDEWREFCRMIDDLPYSEIITADICQIHGGCFEIPPTMVDGTGNT